MNTDKAERDRFHILLMGAIDNELAETEHTEFDALLSSNADFQREFDQYKRLKEITTQMRFKTPPMEIWDSYWLNIYNRIERGIGWLLFSFGTIILLTYGLFKIVETIFMDQSLGWVIKGAIVLAMAGLAVLLASVIRERWFTYKRDPYKEIVR